VDTGRDITALSLMVHNTTTHSRTVHDRTTQGIPGTDTMAQTTTIQDLMVPLIMAPA